MAIGAQVHRSYLWGQKYLLLTTNLPQMAPPLGTGSWVTTTRVGMHSNGAPRSRCIHMEHPEVAAHPSGRYLVRAYSLVVTPAVGDEPQWVECLPGRVPSIL